MSILGWIVVWVAFDVLSHVVQRVLRVEHLPSLASRNGLDFWLRYLGYSR